MTQESTKVGFAFDMKKLEAIEKIPGNGAQEKLSWIAAEIKTQVNAGESLQSITESERFPINNPYLKSMIKIEAAKIFHKLGHNDHDQYLAVSEALQSENQEIVTRALHGNKFFDGSNQEFTNVEYFFKHLLPNVSLKTRNKIFAKLSRCQNPQLGDEFFKATLETFGMDHTRILLPACTEAFIIETIKKHRLVLSTRVLEILSRKYPDLLIWYLKQSDPLLRDSKKRFNHHVNIHLYTNFLVKLMKINLKGFTEIYELHGIESPQLYLNRKQGKRFAQTAREYYLNKPKIYFKLLRDEDQKENDLEIMFPKMLPDLIDKCTVNEMFSLLKNYPKEKTASLMLKSYENVYGKSLLDDVDKVTEKLIRLLAAEDRIRLVRVKIEKEKKNLSHHSIWRCYLPTNEVLPEIREQLKKVADMSERIKLVTEMLNCCEINGDHEALFDLFKYVAERHRNEIPQFHLTFIERVVCILKTMTLKEEQWNVLIEIAHRMYIKCEVSNFKSISIIFLQKALLFRLNQNLSTDLLFEMLFFIFSNNYHNSWNLFSDSPEYERQCLIEFLNRAQMKRDTEIKRWEEIKLTTIAKLMKTISEYNENLTESFQNPIEYHWLFDEIEKINPELLKQNYGLKALILKLNPEMHDRLWPPQPQRTIIEPLDFNKLKKDPKSVLSEWEKYFDECEKFYSSGHVHQFLRSLRWYNELPRIFVERCVHEIVAEKRGKLLVILALLVDGDDFGAFILTLLPTKTKLDVVEVNSKDFSVIHHIASGMLMANPPVSLELLEKLSEGDYLSSALTALLNNCMRSQLTKAITFAKHLANQRVSVAKHGVRLMSVLANLEELREFLSSFWSHQVNKTMRTVVFNATQKLFYQTPNQANWILFKTIILSITEKDDWLVGWPFNVTNVPDEYVEEYMKTQLELIDQLTKIGVKHRYLSSFLSSIDKFICQLLPEEFLKKLFERFLFDESGMMRRVLISVYLAETDEKLNQRLEIFLEILKKTIKDQWNIQNSDSLHYPIRKNVRDLIAAIVYARMDPFVVERLMETFQSVLTHEDDPNSYLLLFYANEWSKAESPKDFAKRIAEKLPTLIEIYTAWFGSKIAETLRDFLTNLSGIQKEEVTREVIETFTAFDTIETAYTALQLLFLSPNFHNFKNYGHLFEKLAKTKHPAVRSFVNSVL